MATLKIRLAQISQIPGHIRWRCILFSPPKRQTGKSFRICLLWCWSMTLVLFFKSANDFDLDLKFLSVRFFGRTFCMSWHFGPTSFGIIERDNLRSVSIRWRQFKFNIFRSIYVFVDFFLLLSAHNRTKNSHTPSVNLTACTIFLCYTKSVVHSDGTAFMNFACDYGAHWHHRTFYYLYIGFLWLVFFSFG